MIPMDPPAIREWVKRMGVSEANAARALGLQSPEDIMRQYCSDARQPAMTTRMHMDLLEVLRDATISLRAKDPKRALAILDKAIQARFLQELTTNQEKP